MDTVGAVKAVTGFVIGAGISSITAEIVKNNVPKSNVYNNITVAAAKFGIAMTVSEIVRRTTDAKIDDIVAVIKKIK